VRLIGNLNVISKSSAIVRILWAETDFHSINGELTAKVVKSEERTSEGKGKKTLPFER